MAAAAPKFSPVADCVLCGTPTRSRVGLLENCARGVLAYELPTCCNCEDRHGIFHAFKLVDDLFDARRFQATALFDGTTADVIDRLIGERP